MLEPHENIPVEAALRLFNIQALFRCFFYVCTKSVSVVAWDFRNLRNNAATVAWDLRNLRNYAAAVARDLRNLRNYAAAVAGKFLAVQAKLKSAN